MRIHREIDIHAPIDQVWQLVSTHEGLRRWWQTLIHFEAKEAGRCEEAGEFFGRPFHRIGKVTHFASPHHIRMAFWEASADPSSVGGTSNGAPSELTIVAITLAETPNSTRVTVEQTLPYGNLIPATAFGHVPGSPPDAISGATLPTLQWGGNRQPTPIHYPPQDSRTVAPRDTPQSELFGTLWAGRLETLQSVLGPTSPTAQAETHEDIQ